MLIRHFRQLSLNIPLNQRSAFQILSRVLIQVHGQRKGGQTMQKYYAEDRLKQLFRKTQKEIIEIEKASVKNIQKKQNKEDKEKNQQFNKKQKLPKIQKEQNKVQQQKQKSIKSRKLNEKVEAQEQKQIKTSQSLQKNKQNKRQSNHLIDNKIRNQKSKSSDVRPKLIRRQKLITQLTSQINQYKNLSTESSIKTELLRQVRDNFRFFNTFIKKKRKLTKRDLLIEEVINNDVLNLKLDQLGQAETLQSLIQGIKSCTNNEFQRFWAVYYWMTHNISYDFENYFANKPGANKAHEVFLKGKCVCQGYSNLFLYLCQNLELQCKKICGYAKGLSYKVGQKPLKQTNHAWNLITYNQKQYLIDSTWGAVNKNVDQNLSSQFNVFYFLADPQALISTHFPENPNFQLLYKPISRAQFFQRPKFQDLYFTYKLKLLGPGAQSFRQMRSQQLAFVNLQCAYHNQLSFLVSIQSLKGNTSFKNNYLTFLQPTGYQIVILFPSKGTFNVKFFAKQAHLPFQQKYSQLFELTYKVQRCAKELSFPQFYTIYNKLNCYVFTPMIKQLASNQLIQFKIQIPSALEVQVVDDQVWNKMSKEEGSDIFSGKFMFKEGSTPTVYAKFQTESNYSAVVAYECR